MILSNPNLGKRISLFGGDEHNFKHLYKSGVNYFRPGADNGSLRTQFNDADIPFSMHHDQVAGFSTVDILEKGTKMILSAHNTDGVVFYTQAFTLNNRQPQK